MSDEMMTEEDQSHLNILGICYYVAGGLGLAGGAVFILMFGAFMLPALSSASSGNGGSGPPASAFGFMIVFFGGFLIIALISGIAMIYAGHCLRNHQHRIFCFVVACIACLNAPLGTVLGVFTIIVLSRPQVKAAFEQPPW